MQMSRRSVLRGGASSLAMLALPLRAGAQDLPNLDALYQPGVEAMADTVKAIVDMLKPGIIGVDMADIRAVLAGAGAGGFGQGSAQQTQRRSSV